MHERWSRSYVAAGSDHTRHNDSSPVRMNRSEFSPSAPAHRPTIPIHKRQDRVTYCRLVATPIPSHLSRGYRRTRRSMRLGDVMSTDDLEAAGLGLERGWVELVEVPVEWLGIGFQLSAGLAASLGALAVRVEHIGSTSVSGLLAKPVLDVAIGTFPDADLAAITDRLAQRRWLYRGDAGDQGGHVCAWSRQHCRWIHQREVVRHRRTPALTGGSKTRGTGGLAPYLARAYWRRRRLELGWPPPGRHRHVMACDGRRTAAMRASGATHRRDNDTPSGDDLRQPVEMLMSSAARAARMTGCRSSSTAYSSTASTLMR